MKATNCFSIKLCLNQNQTVTPHSVQFAKLALSKFHPQFDLGPISLTLLFAIIVKSGANLK